jgi:hypothetical protein
MEENVVRYVLFDLESRNVNGIMRNKPSIGETWFEIPYAEALEFIEGRKNTANYTVIKDVANGSWELKQRITNIALHFLDDRLYKVPLKDLGEIRIINSIEENKITFMMEKNFQEYLIKKYGIDETTQVENIDIEGAKVLDFVLCYDNDPHNLISYCKIPTLQLLLQDKVTVSYSTTHSNHCVYTKRIYNDYAYSEI